ncbi:CRISPR-associated endonuclease/helicase Cas3 [Alkalithermobacter thermoalcaliphilus JW-YL-7 = DSM 7308]|uniref:CRISPR-associated endonuclease/helicase Cas3 n=1 Tax=Alkalithermobacter thermoalcaliphilus JW-YL-7 = DSM 7308 TaxID=1121328 RepID=A0A150FSF7_CLOPD|nr:CRISPR-associated helicase Cas3 [[Clostridium] paradoxum JW-YL-7 = DSM 7308]SHL29941.1 CRISPR-associated endonuclease/helicase Cas3 [[Clostridium] paradoxum JW-YL-7 = DSM 7308]
MIYAKSDPVETLREHTDKAHEQLDLLKRAYGEKITQVVDVCKDNFWEIMHVCVEFHDVGKVFIPFQNVIREKVGREKLKTEFKNTIPHSYISPAVISFKKLNIEDEQLRKVIVQSIGYHHERDIIIDKELIELIEQVIENELNSNVEEIQKEIKLPIRKKMNAGYLKKLQNRISEKEEYYYSYVLVKGLLHRIDHSASAHEKIELDFDKNVGEYVEKFIMSNYNGLRDVQKFAKQNKDKNIILIASTGMGKTETALLWIDNHKAFFTLPLRVSINALFDRVSKTDEEGINYPYAGLLHSTSIDYLEENEYEGFYEIYDQSKLLSKKLTFSTIDQIFKFPFKYRGYEKIYATLAYSKVVIDEIQAYSPKIAAVLIKGIELLHKIGANFMIMTATMPSLYIDELKKRGIFDENLIMAQYNTEIVRHKISLINKCIYDDIDKIIEKAQDKKVLVIMNTVNGAVELFNMMTEKENNMDIYLLHSMFIQQHRTILESQIKDFAKESKSGLWITTQLVEASLDVDFDFLYTELSTLDSLFQRLGRCNRKGKKLIDESNILIYTQNVNGIGTIYDKDIFRNSLELLNEFVTNNPDGLIEEVKKVELVSELYSTKRLQNSKFLKEFTTALEILDHMDSYNLTSNEAQGILREIESYTVIPRDIYDEVVYGLISEYEELESQLNQAYRMKNKDIIDEIKNKRRLLKRKIIKNTVAVPTYKVKNNLTRINVNGLKDLFILEYKYEFKEKQLEKDKKQYTGRGILFGQELSQFI